MGGTNGVSGNGNNYFKVSDFWSKPSLQPAKTEQTMNTAPINFSSESVKRENLDELSPYAGLVHLSKKPPMGSVESYMAAAPEFGRWQGNFGSLSGQEIAALDKFSNICDRVAKDKAEVTAHLEECPLDFFSA